MNHLTYKNKRLLVLVFAILGCTAVFSQDTSDLRLWSPAPISWSDFKENPGYDKYVRKRAKTAWRFKVSVSDSIASENQTTVKVEAFLVRSNSWVRSVNLTDRTLLMHEQLHFDIVEWFARQLRQQLTSQVFKKEGYHKEIEKIKRKILNRLDTKQWEYDRDTQGGNITKVQDEWSNAIVSGINELHSFANTSVLITLK